MTKPVAALQIIAFPLIVLALIPVMFLVVFLSPALLGYMLFDAARMRRASRSFVCVRCGNVLGLSALQRASDERGEDDSWLARYSDEYLWTAAICPTCQAKYGFEKGSFMPL
jgi:hypothetical protein